MPTKACTKCGQIKTVDQFYAYHGGSRDGRPRSSCKACELAQMKLRPPQKSLRSDHRRAYERTLRQTMRLLVLTHYSNGEPMCKCCGEDGIEFLVIDHVNNDGSAHRRSLTRNQNKGGSYKTYAWLKRNNFPPGFQVLCCNCNSAKAIYGTCPHSSSHIDSAKSYG